MHFIKIIDTRVDLERVESYEADRDCWFMSITMRCGKTLDLSPSDHFSHELKSTWRAKLREAADVLDKFFGIDDSNKPKHAVHTSEATIVEAIEKHLPAVTAKLVETVAEKVKDSLKTGTVVEVEKKEKPAEIEEA